MSAIEVCQYYQAIVNGRDDEVRDFLRQGTFSADTELLEKEEKICFDSRGRYKTLRIFISALQLAAKNGKVLVLTELLQQSPDTKFRDSALFTALEKGHKQAVEILLQYGANPFARLKGNYWETACSYAVEYQTAFMDLFLRCKYASEEEGKEDRTELLSRLLQDVIRKEENEQMAELLLTAGANPNKTQFAYGGSLLERALLRGEDKMVALLLRFGARVECCNALNQVIEEGNLEKIRLLIKYTPINSLDSQQKTPLVVAVEKGDPEIVILLLERGADPNAFQKSPLFIAVEKGDLKIVILLLKRGANPNAVDCFKRTPLCVVKDSKIATFLLNAGADVNYNHNGESPLSNAVINGNIALVRFFLGNRANPNPTNGCRPLHEAVSRESYGIVSLLLKAGADPNLFPGLRSPLENAVITHNDFAMAKLLLEHKANPWVEYAGFPIYWVVLDGRYGLEFSQEMKDLFRKYGPLIEPPKSKFPPLPYSGPNIS